MRDEVKIGEIVDIVLRPASQEHGATIEEHDEWLDGGEDWKDFSLVHQEVNSVNIIDLKGKAFKFTGTYLLSLVGDSVYLRAK